MIRSENAHLLVSASSHPGMTGKNNEDRFVVTTYRIGPDNNTASLLAVICDGIGGHRAGEVAAEIAANTITQLVAQSDAKQPLETLQDAIQVASQRIFEQARDNSERWGMGTTCACAWVIGNRLYTIYVGDSRIYLQRKGNIYPLSIDHTYVQELLEMGKITPDQMKDHPNAHVIRRYLGSAVPPEGDTRKRAYPDEKGERSGPNQGLLLQPGDHILLCSDGLTDLVEDAEIKVVLESLASDKDKKTTRARQSDGQANGGRKPIDSVVQGLIDLANQRGGHDNITIIALEVPYKAATETKRSGWARAWRLVLTGCLTFITIALLASLALLGWTWWQSRLQPTLEVTPSPVIDITSQVPGNLDFTETPQPTTESSPRPSLPASTPPLPTAVINEGPTLTPWPTNALPGSSPTTGAP